MKSSVILIGMFIVVLCAILGTSKAQTAGIANVTIPFSGLVASQQAGRELIASRMESLRPDAQGVGVSAIRLQSVAYTLTPNDKGYAVDGNLFIDVIPEGKTEDFVASLQKKGAAATINYFQICRPR